MSIRIGVCRLGQKRSGVSAQTFELEKMPATLRELIEESVRACVGAYNERLRMGDAAQPMTQEQMQAMERVGKLAFGVNYNGHEADLETAQAGAVQGFLDGWYRVFCNQQELTGLDAPLELKEQDEITFIRLTMLTGSMW